MEKENCSVILPLIVLHTSVIFILHTANPFRPLRYRDLKAILQFHIYDCSSLSDEEVDDKNRGLPIAKATIPIEKYTRHKLGT